MQLHEKICLLRKVKGWSQEEMADKLQMSVHGYANIERGETDVQLSRLEQISQVLGVELQNLFGMNDRVVFNLTNTSRDQSSQNNFQFLMAQRELEYELEKARLIIEQQNKEIKYLKEIIELMKTQS
ncbi:transcription factor, MBF1 [Thioploca ingrica]|uniref:Transcription factor, MBF1 n=1 Tax=Thioploca ingrica TaxID=40754 RepID=A0A090BVR2_9GAMM|nr:transcription factor, MBF1 [Thioploca ingrica]